MDKRDGMTIGAALTGIDLEWIEGVHMNEMSEKAYPAVRVSVAFGSPISDGNPVMGKATR